ncbi:tetratricopeptide repeat protein [Actinomadura chibensis]|uniref:Tetratricopeptide repeat protein n=1 Tax=Actinomadura chibensis TaxID=392828 RepID=A0A5D0N0I9_9ACTN|nr:tetratricopeptide repeat protein [Actinomadura chibensis]TYB37980.1 tetratricopeptide repeat protein [Actinomadura chibensis]
MLLKCSGWACMRLISVSKARGGNPVALNDPENFAVEFMICEDCGDYFCDRCHAPGSRFRAPRCASCGGRLAPGKRLEQLSGRPRPPAVEHLRRGVELVESDRAEDALAELGEAVRLRPEYAAAHYWRGGALVRLGRDAEALDAFDNALRHNPADVAALYEKAGALARMEHVDEAIDAYDRTIALQPGFPAAHLNRAVLVLDEDRDAEALAAAEHVLALIAAGRTRGGSTYDAASAHSIKGAALVKLGRFAEALPAIDYAIDNGLDSWNDYYNKAYALERLGRTEEADLARGVSDSLRES